DRRPDRRLGVAGVRRALRHRARRGRGARRGNLGARQSASGRGRGHTHPDRDDRLGRISGGRERAGMTDDYEASPWEWVSEQVATYERTGGREANTLRDTGLPIVVVTTRGNKSGKVRKTPLMRVEHNGEYALVASMGGAPKHPVWYFNVKADPHVKIQDGPEPMD